MLHIKKASPGLDQRNKLGSILGPGYTIEDYDPSRPLADQVSKAEVLLIRDIPIGAAVMDAAKSLKLIQRPGAHVVGVDYEAARSRGIPVSRFPSEIMGQPARDVAEHAMFLLLAVAKRYREAQSVLGRRSVGLPKTYRLDGKTLALLGVGNTGAELAELARGFGMKVIAIKQTPDPELAKRLGITFLGGLKDLGSVLEKADFVSLHLPNNSSTRDFLSHEQFARMKRGALLVNIARAPMINKDALVQALKSGHLGGAGLDVWWEEPADPDDELFTLANVVVTPHIAGDTEELEYRLAQLAAENIERVSRGERPSFVIGDDVDPL